MGFGDWLSEATLWWDQHTNPFHGMFGESEMEAKQREKTGKEAPKGFATRPLEGVMSGLAWTRDNAISRPLTTLELMIDKVTGNPTGNDVISGAEWKKSWNAAQHISPGQAMFSGGRWWHATPVGRVYDFFDPSNEAEQTRQLESAPLEYKRPEALPEGFNELPWDEQQRALKAAGMPVQGNALIEAQRRNSDYFKYGTGIVDFGLSWYADPLVIAGKGVGAVRTATVVRPVDATWTGTRIDKELQRNVMVRAQEFIYANRDKPQLLNNLSIANRSAMGPRFGQIASTLQTPEEVNLFLRVGLGDTRAMEELTRRNKLAGDIISKDTSRLPQWELMRSRFANNPQMQALVDREIDAASTRVAANTALVTRYNQILDHAHEIDKINLTRNSFAQAEAKTAAQNAYTAGPAFRQGRQDLTFTRTSAINIGRRVPGQPFFELGGGTERALQREVVDPLPGGGQVVSTRVYSGFFQTPLTVLRSFGEYRPNGHINVQGIDQESVNELRGFVARIPNMGAADRERVVNAYLSTASEGDRVNLIQSLERQGMREVAGRHGFTVEEADELYNAHARRLAAEKAALKAQNQFSTVKMPGAEPGEKIRVDAFPDGTGGYKIHPNLVSRLINDTQMIDLNLYDLVLRRNKGALQAMRSSSANPRDWVERGAEWFNSAWKFATLFRIGYIPRVLGDDLAGQMARLGAATMALRAGWGIKNAATNLARKEAAPFLEARQEVSRQGLAYADEELAALGQRIGGLEQKALEQKGMNQRDLQLAQRRVFRAQGRVNEMPPTATAAQQGAAQKLLEKRQAALREAQALSDMGLAPGQMMGLNDLRLRKGYLEHYRGLLERELDQAGEAQQKVFQGGAPIDIDDGFQVPGAFSGQRGEMYQTLVSSQRSLDAIFRTNKQLVHGNLMRSWNHGAVPVNALADPDGHMAAWKHVINAQFGNDALARRALAGASVRDMEQWLLRTPEGIAYRTRIGENLTSADDLARRVHYDVNEIVPTPELRAQALTPEGVAAEHLEGQFPNPATRPDVHHGQLGANLEGGNDQRQGLNKIMDTWFKWAATIPADRMSRHPLYNQLYEGHARRIAGQEKAQGRTLTTANDAERIAEAARRLALRDTRGLVFDIAHRSDAASALRFISPFFAATTESWQRWARIIADKPEVAGYAVKFFNAPLAMGVIQDKDGNTVDRYGYAYDPVQQKRVLVGKGDRRIVMRLPKFMVEGRNPIGVALGASPAGDINLSQDSMNLVLSGDPWFNPGQGPIVTIPLGEFVSDKPAEAEMLQHIGVLPFGPSTKETFVGRVFDQVAPRTIKDFLTAYDTTDERYQQVKAQVMQRAAYEHANLGKDMPNATEIADRVRNYWLFSAASAFLGPVAGKSNDPYQFYRDEYNKMRRATANGPTDELGRPTGPSADDLFLDKYGESFFVFAQQMSKNVGGIPATLKAAELSKKYADLIAMDPDLAALYVGPEGNGPFSPAVYSYQLNTPLTPGGAEMQRRRLTADEAMKENERRLGWAKYTARMNSLNAELVRRGLNSFKDPAARDLLQKKQGYTKLYTEPFKSDGETPNEYYIAEFAKDFNSLDRGTYERRIPALTALARSDLANDPARSDLRVLQNYLGARSVMTRQLAERDAAGGSASLAAKSNADLRNQWEFTVQKLILANTSFGDLYHRYLSRDMESNVEALFGEGGAG